jgi:hypothetical protein
MTALWERTISAAPGLERWLASAPSELHAARLPRPAWAIVAGSVARACHARGRPLLVLAPAPDSFADELRLWLAGRPPTHVFAEVAVSFLDRPPAHDSAVSKRLETLAALADAGNQGGVRRDPALPGPPQESPLCLLAIRSSWFLLEGPVCG